MLRNIGVTYRLGDQPVRGLEGVDLEIERGELCAVVGASGSGKSTLLNVLGCLCPPTVGEYWLGGRDVAGLDDDALARVRGREIGFVFQSFQLLPRMTALANVALPLSYQGVAPAERRRRAEAALERVGLADRTAHRPHQLSGGQRQRVAIARALVTRPTVILADEPTGSLDSTASGEILALLVDLNRAGHTVVLVTHDPSVAAAAGRQVRVHDGRVVADRRFPAVAA